jgi:hypothetical protein
MSAPRPKRFTYTLTALSAAGFAAAVTGAINTTPWTTIVGAPPDGAGHLATLTLASGGSLAGVNITVIGTDAEGRYQTETIAGPSATTTMTKYFATVTSITSDATLGASTMNVGWLAACYTPTIPVADYPHTGPLVGVTLGGTVTFTVQQTNDNIWDNNPAEWFDFIPQTDQSIVGKLVGAQPGATGIRCYIASHTSGIIYLTLSQARV